ncbi:unnamed protein product [Owenia fusiformis]|uniref:C3H1-type domain-containing protein n=1 Tax=Owenia fusiformis TaxID=6347 RepID=A0A8S4PTS5_OWEFU|nr:unnamed protein product [Owenia fusiformis]
MLVDLVDKLAKSGDLSADILSTDNASAKTPVPTESTGHNGKKPLLIPDFVTNAYLPQNDQEEISMGNNLFYRPGNKTVKPRLDNVTLPQWVSASCRILQQLIKDGAELTVVKEYVSHMINVGDHAQTNTVTSTLLYEDACRKKQHENMLTWGEDDIHLMNFYLVKKPTTPRGAPHQRGDRSSNGNPTQNTQSQVKNANIPICRQWNSARGCSYGSSCKFTHGKCAENNCGEAHPQYLHASLAK